MSSFNNWQTSGDYPASNAPFRAAEQSGPQPVFRDELDAARSMYRRTPDAQYPDGYLGTINPRRQDRLKQNTARANNKPYMRGVHKGERMDNKDYFWPDEFRPEHGIMAQMEGHRFVSQTMLQSAGLTKFTPPAEGSRPMDRVGVRGVPARVGTVNWGTIDTERTEAMRRLAPEWSAAKAGAGIGMGTAYPGR